MTRIPIPTLRADGEKLLGDGVNLPVRNADMARFIYLYDSQYLGIER